jgi:hypothetical protein
MGQKSVTAGPKNQRGIAAAYEHPRVTNETNRKPTETKTSTEITSSGVDRNRRERGSKFSSQKKAFQPEAKMGSRSTRSSPSRRPAKLFAAVSRKASSTEFGKLRRPNKRLGLWSCENRRAGRWAWHRSGSSRETSYCLTDQLTPDVQTHLPRLCSADHGGKHKDAF